MEEETRRGTLDVSDDGTDPRPEGIGLHSSKLPYAGRHQGLLRLKQWIAVRGALSLTLDEAARVACLDPCHFSKVFHAHVGVSFKQWRRSARISSAIMALQEGSHSLADIARLSGYQDRRAFERAVKRLTGQTPARIYRGPRDSVLCRAVVVIETQVKPQTRQVEPQPGNFLHESIPRASLASPPSGGATAEAQEEREECRDAGG